MKALVRKEILPVVIVVTGLTILTIASWSQAMTVFRILTGAIDSRSMNMDAQGPQGTFQEVAETDRIESADKQKPAFGSMTGKGCGMMDSTDHEAMMKDGKTQDIDSFHKNLKGFDHGPKNQETGVIELKQTL